jgi:type II secretory pathway component PulF
MNRTTQEIMQKYFKYTALYLSSGRGIDESFEMALSKVSNITIKKHLSQLVYRLREGQDIKDSLGHLLKKQIIDSTIYSFVLIGQRTSSLSSMLMNISLYLNKKLSFKKSLLGSILYPAVVLLSSVLSVFYIVNIILPKIVPLFSSLRAPLPPSTVALLDISNIISTYFFHFLAFIIFSSSILFFMHSHFDKFRFYIHKHIYNLPIVGSVILAREIRDMCLCIGSLMKSGIGPVDCIETYLSLATNSYIKYGMSIAKDGVMVGKNISDSIPTDHLLSKHIVDFINLGESTGTLAQAFMDLADIASFEYEDHTSRLSKVAEPMALIFSAGIVLVVALSVISPMYLLVQYVN